jgi:hypothetical protein
MTPQQHRYRAACCIAVRLPETSKRVILTVVALGCERVPLRENGDESHWTLPLRSNQL